MPLTLHASPAPVAARRQTPCVTMRSVTRLPGAVIAPPGAIRGLPLRVVTEKRNHRDSTSHEMHETLRERVRELHRTPRFGGGAHPPTSGLGDVRPRQDGHRHPGTGVPVPLPQWHRSRAGPYAG